MLEMLEKYEHIELSASEQSDTSRNKDEKRVREERSFAEIAKIKEHRMEWDEMKSSTKMIWREGTHVELRISHFRGN